MRRHFVRVGDREVHYRRAGNGPPFVLFHSSPQSAGFVMPGLMPLAGDWTLIGLDTPGYGGSDPLPMAAPTAVDYADAAAEAMTALGIACAPVYGTHTGAHIAMELAVRHPDRVAGLVLDGVSFNTPEEAQERLDKYAPEFTPTTDGAHLAWAWQHTRDQIVYYPWFRAEKARRLNAAMAPPAYIHDIVLAKMDAADYWLGYRAAFSHDSRAVMYDLNVKTTVVARDGDVLAPEAKRLTDLPAGVRVLETGKDDWMAAIRDSLAWCDAGDVTVAPAPVPGPSAATSRCYVDIGDGQRLVRRGGDGAGRPLVLLHGEMSSSRVVLPLAEALGGERPFLALDIAGNAESDALAPGADLTAFVADVVAVLDEAAVETCDVYADGVGASLALALAATAGERVARLVLDEPVVPTGSARDELQAHYAPDMTPQWDGGHWLTAWHMLRDRAFFWPWYERTQAAIRHRDPAIDPAALQVRLLDWLKGRATYGDYVRACLGADAAQMTAVSQPVLVIASADDVLAEDADRLESSLTQVTRYGGEHDPAATVARIAGFLDG
jgi:pimeloyl-ACP methyl ester carboxylesterase